MKKKLYGLLFALIGMAQMQANFTPTAARIYGDYFIDGVAQDQALGAAGSFDTTFGSGGVVALSNQQILGQAQAILNRTCGSFIVGVSAVGANSKIVSLLNNGTLGSAFGTAGVVDLGSNTPAIQSMVLDMQRRILVAGGDATHSNLSGWMSCVSSDGTVILPFALSTPWQYIGAIAQQSTGNIITVGSNGSNAQIARYNFATVSAAGQLDGTFGSSGVVVFNGTAGLPNVTAGLNNLVIDAQDNIYVGYVDNNQTIGIIKLQSNGSVNQAFGHNGVQTFTAFGTTGARQICLAMDANNNFVLAVQVGQSIVCANINALTGAAITGFVGNALSGNSSLQLQNLLTTNDNKIIVISNDMTTNKINVTKLSSLGVLDTTWQQTGSSEFSFGTLGNAAVCAVTCAVDGRLLIAGSQNSTSPCIAALYNAPYVTKVPQSAMICELGSFDKTFGAAESYTGVIAPFNGLYGSLLQQKARSAISLASGNLLLGMDGKLNTSNYANMMLCRMTPAGAFDTTFGSGLGFVALPSHQQNEYLTAMFEDASKNIYVAGYGTTGAILRKYTSAGVESWVGDLVRAGSQGLSIGLQGAQRVLLGLQGASNQGGGIIAHSITTGAVDTTFHAAGATPGLIQSTDFGLKMGGLYGILVNGQENIFIAYKNSVTGGVDLAAIYNDGSGLIPEFGTAGVVSNIFSSAAIAVNNIRVAFDNDYNIIVAACTTTSLCIAHFDGAAGILDTNFNGSGLLTIPSLGNNLAITNCVGLSDGSIIITAYDVNTDYTMLLVSITSAGVLNSGFNPQSPMPGVLPFKVGDVVQNYAARIVTAATVQQSTGDIVLSGYEQQTVTDSTPIVLRVHGTAGNTQIQSSPVTDATAGTLDTTFNGTGYADITKLIASGAAKVVYAYRSGSAYQSKLLVGIQTASSVKIARIDALDMILDPTFGTNGVITIPSLQGLNHISLDANNKILLAGSSSVNGWIRRLTKDGLLDVSVAIPSDIVGINHLYQQKSGRYIACGKDSQGNGVLLAFQDVVVNNASSLGIDTTFNPLGTKPGRYNVSATGLASLSIMNDDSIVVAYAVANGCVTVANVKADGTALVSGFATSGIFTTTITPKNNSEIKVAIDSNQKIVVAASVGGTSVSIVRLLSNGTVDTAFNGSGAVQSITNLGVSGVTLAHLMTTNETTGDDKIIILGSNVTGGNGSLFAARLASNGLLDTTFNSNAISTDRPGVYTYNVPNVTAMYAGSIFINGKIYVAGQGGVASPAPILIRLYGDNYICESEQQPFEVKSGIVDTTLDTVTPGSGAINLNSLTGLAIGTITQSYAYPSGAILLFSNSRGSSFVTRLKADFSVDTTFGVNGMVTIPKANSITNFYVANGLSDNGSIYLVGSNGVTAWSAQVSSTGTLVSSGALNSTIMSSAFGVIKTSNGRILIAGQNSATGLVAAYKSDGLTLDQSFGDGLGYYATNVTTPVVGMTMDNANRIYIAYKDIASLTIKVVRLLANGGAIDPTWTLGAIAQTNALSATQICMEIDQKNQQLVVVVQDGQSSGNCIKVARFSMAQGFAGMPTGSVSSIMIPLKIVNLSDIIIDSIQNIYILGYDSSNNYLIAARVAHVNATTLALDTSYAATGLTPGIARVAAGKMTSACMGVLQPDRRLYFVGNGSGNPYMARLFGDLYTTAVNQALFVATPGALDFTIDANDTVVVGGIVCSSLANWASLAGLTAYSLQANADGTSYIAFGDGTNLIVGKVDADMNPVVSFGINGLTQTYPMQTISRLIVDSLGKVVVSGTNNGSQEVVRFTQSGNLDVVFTPIQSSVSTTIGEQKSGRLLVGSLINSSGALCAYQNTGLGLDMTFGPAALNGYYATNVNAQIDDFVIDSNDCIYLVYRNAFNHVMVEKIVANGSGKVSTFNNGLALDTGMIALATQPACIALNNSGNILVAVTTNSAAQTCLFNGTTGGALSPIQTIVQGTTIAPSIPLAGYPTISQVVGSGTDFVGSIFTTTPSIVTFRILGTTGTLDSGFGSFGLATFTGASDPDGTIAVNSVSILPDGRITMVGTNSVAPSLMRIYGYPYVGLNQAMPGRAPAGLLDTTLGNQSQSTMGINGASVTNAYDLNNFGSLGLNLHGYTIKHLHEYGNGIMLFVANNGQSTIMFRLLKDLTLDVTNFNAPSGYVTIPSKITNANGLYVQDNGNIFVVGGTGTSWAAAYTNAGLPLPGFTAPAVNLPKGAYAVGLQSCGRVIVAGQGAVNGSLYGYTNSGTLDSEFGVNGIIATGFAAPIIDISIDSLDRIVLVYVNAGMVTIQRVTADGNIVTTLNAGTPISGVTNNGIRVVQDSNGNIIVAASTNSGFVLRRYNSNGTSNGQPITITTSGAVMGNLYITNDNKVVMAGYAGQNCVVARIDSNFNLDATFNNGSALITSAAPMNIICDAVIHADDRVMLVGGSSTVQDPYMARIFGDAYTSVIRQCPCQGVAGMVDKTYGQNGVYNLATAGFGNLVGMQSQAIIALPDGSSFIALNNQGVNSQLLRTIVPNGFNAAYGTAGMASTAPDGVWSMMIDGIGRPHLVGTSVNGYGWLQRYLGDNSGSVDLSCNGTGVINCGAGTMATIVVQQTLGRLIIAGKDATGQGVLWAYTNAGQIDTTFNSLVTAGSYGTSVHHGIYALLVDQYDRLICAYQNGSGVDLVRLTASGELDQSFGINGIITAALSGVDNESQVQLAMNSVGNIVLAAHTTKNGVPAIAVITYDNLTALSGNGLCVNAEYDLVGLQNPSLTSMLATTDGDLILVGNQAAGANSCWIARLIMQANNPITLDTNFSPSSSMPGVTFYNGNGLVSHLYAGSTVRPDGRLVIVGNEDTTPNVVRFYNDPYTVQDGQASCIKPVGTADTTLGLAGSTGLTFFGLTGGAAQGQIAQAVALQDDNTMVVALDGQSIANTDNRIFLNVFDIDGLAEQSFGAAGKVEVSHIYQNEYVRDLLTFSSNGVNKAILVGYATNSVLNITGSLVYQYNLSSASLDSSFGGLNGNPAGIAFGDGMQAYVVGRQSTGRIIVAGSGQNGKDMILGYTAFGKLDKTFGIGGSLTRGTNPLYACVIDNANNIVTVYNDGNNNLAVARTLANGSALDTSFGTGGLVSTMISGISGTSNMRVALDGSGNIIAAAVTASGKNCVINRYLPNGTLDVSLTVTSAMLGTLTNFVLTKLLVDIDGKVIIVGYDVARQNQIVVARTTTSLSGLDTGFNTAGTPGYSKYAIAGGVTQIATDAIIHPDGRIIVVGAEN